jgi:hypothetical protein
VILNTNDALAPEEISLTHDEIIEALTHDTRPAGWDGCSNVDRIAFVLEVFDLETIDLTIAYDFTPVTEVDCVFQRTGCKTSCTS